mmetsp:Transcript_22604/g.31502  ORF Transcript_22604/g.31502 Transcript_22604/m.31502 type:complete len:514 (+) Transcript_22604:177-1718(+)|eukprot:CAMPEP_0196580416 /NCGR_PEP_ID=MMETSP1081-20130531/28615_1 /TAXON_ID=36882 /ORGANISM="Pyramimonas amylifera, Strain CCMP720" /LENGTH=513 /DNA_ID=CAMNT_0041900277 /DNA_START=176 /DNA_END=1717 /DNA_ORIENTATION=-
MAVSLPQFLVMVCLFFVASVLGEYSEEKADHLQMPHRKLFSLSLERWMMPGSHKSEFTRRTEVTPAAESAAVESTPAESAAIVAEETSPVVAATPTVAATPVAAPAVAASSSSSVTVAQTPFGAKQQPIFCEDAVVAFNKCIQTLKLKPGQVPGAKMCHQPRRELEDCHVMKKVVKDFLTMSVPNGKVVTSFSDLAPANCDLEKNAKNECTERVSIMFPKLKTTSKTKLAMQEAQKTAEIEQKCADENYLFNACNNKIRGSKLLDDAQNATLIEMKAAKQPREKHHHGEDGNLPKLGAGKEKSLNNYKNALMTTTDPIDCETVHTEFDGCMAIALTTLEGKKLHNKGQDEELAKTHCLVEQRKLKICHDEHQKRSAATTVATVPPLGTTPVDLPASVAASLSGDSMVPVGVPIVVPDSTPAPAAEIPAPAVEIPAPAAEIPAPATEIPALAAEIPAPAVEIPAPAAEIPAPTAKIPVPAVETPAPAVKTPAPVVSSSTSTVSSSTPATTVPAV